MTNSTAEIWDKFNVELRRYIARRVENPQDTDDLLQDTFIKIHTHIDTLQAEDRIAPWIYRITRNTITDFYRTRKNHIFISENLIAEEEFEDNDLEKGLALGLREMIDQLPDKYRQTLVLSELQGMKQSEVAELLGLSLSGAKSRLQRGREQLRHELLDCCHFEFDRRGKILDYIPKQTCCLQCNC
jgi:RNA polymerase sigma-70 factor, ECF subfamily